MAMVSVVCPCCGKNIGKSSTSMPHSTLRCTNSNCRVVVVIEYGQVCGWK